jgi:thiol-disulfide isomerase/thioredoxin
VRYDPDSVSLDTILNTIKSRGFTPSLAPPAEPPPAQSRLSEEEVARLDVRTISHGEAVRLEEHLVAGKVTIFDYYADWCGPCLLLGRDLERLLASRSDLALRKIDIMNWESEAARQALREFKLQGIPYVRVFGPRGKFLGAVSENDVAQVRALLPAAGDD